MNIEDGIKYNIVSVTDIMLLVVDLYSGDLTCERRHPLEMSMSPRNILNDLQFISENRNRRRYWIGVVSEEHVRYGVNQGIGQTCHGKATKLKEMNEGDYLIYYSPSTSMLDGEPLQAFTALGRVADDSVYKYQISETFVPYRRKIQYLSCRNVSIKNLLHKLSITRDRRSWGQVFRSGQFEISEDDFMIIANEMLSEEHGFHVVPSVEQMTLF